MPDCPVTGTLGNASQYTVKFTRIAEPQFDIALLYPDPEPILYAVQVLAPVLTTEIFELLCQDIVVFGGRLFKI
jgi:hypothetical protein